MNTSRLSAYAPVIVRVAIAFVLAWFGTNQFMHPEMWTRVVPAYASGMFGSALTVVHINAWFETIMAVILLIGFQVRIVGLILAIHLASIASTFGLMPTGVRDFGLTIAALSIFFAGPDVLSLDRKLAARKSSAVPVQQ